MKTRVISKTVTRKPAITTRTVRSMTKAAIRPAAKIPTRHVRMRTVSTNAAGVRRVIAPSGT